MTLRSKIDDSYNNKLIEDSKRNLIKEEDGTSRMHRKASILSRKDGDLKTSDRVTSQYSNQETPEEITNFNRTNSRLSNSK